MSVRGTIECVERALPIVALLLWSGWVVWYFSACSPGANRRAVDLLLRGAEIACIVANAELPDDESIADACHLSRDLGPVIRDVVSSHKAGVARVMASRASACADAAPVRDR